MDNEQNVESTGAGAAYIAVALVAGSAAFVGGVIGSILTLLAIRLLGA